MIDALIFSKDRPAQLDLLLRSMEQFAFGYLIYTSLTVQYIYTNGRYAQGYDICRERFPSLCWRAETAGSFERDLKGWLHSAGETISFYVDDDVFYRPARWEKPQWDSNPLKLPISLRPGDYDYPFSLDGNIYRKQDVTPLIESVNGWRNPTVFEAGMHELRDRLPFTEVSPVPPCLVGVPANRVSEHSGMPHMGISTAWLNERYLQGDRIDLAATVAPLRDGTVEPAPHVELRYVLESGVVA